MTPTTEIPKESHPPEARTGVPVDPQALVRLDPELWFRMFGVFKNKKGRLVRGAKPTPVQMKMFAAYRRCRAEKKPCLMLVLKPRKDGASTGAQAIAYHHLRTFDGRQGAQMGDQIGTSANLFEMFRTFYDNDRFEWRQGPRDPALNQTDTITMPNGSSYGQVTAGSTNAGRSGTLQVANATEVAFFPKSERDPALGYLNSAYLEGEEGLAIWDTTPNGPQGVFYNLWQDKGNGWIKIFTAWFENEEHATAFASEAERQAFADTMDDDEREEMARYALRLEQMHWRRATIRNKCEGSATKFRQEYPSNDVECWLGSARLKFRAQSLAEMMEVAKLVKPERGEMMMQENGLVTWQPDDHGSVEMWERPRVGCRYLGVADTCTGEDQQMGGAQADPDYHSLGILRAEYTDEGGVYHPPRLVAHHWSRIDSDLAAAQMAAMSVFYGRCLVVPEVNACGLVMVKELERLEIPVYRRKKMDRVNNLVQSAAGWKTDETTRKTLIDKLTALIRDWTRAEPTIEIHSVWILEQCQHFVQNERGRSEAMQGHHDDGVMMMGIGAACLELATEFQLPRRVGPTVDEINRREGWRRLKAPGRR